MTEEMHVDWGAEQLASERMLLAAERTFSVCIRTGLTAVGGGLAAACVLVFKSHAHELLAHAIGGLLVVWVHPYSSTHSSATIAPARDYHQRACSETHWAMKMMTATLLVIAALVLWITLS